MIDLLRARLVVVTAMMVVVSLAAGAVFDRRIWSLALVPLVVAGCAWVAFDWRWLGRLALGIGAVVGAAAIVVALRGGAASDLFVAFGSGPRRILSTEWPSPDRPELLGTTATALGLVTLLATELTRRERFHLSPLLPVVAMQILVIALSAPQGPNLWWILALAVLAIVFSVLRPGPDGQLTERLGLLRGERRLVPTALLTVGVAAIVAAPLALTARADPRRTEPAATAETVIDPIEATLALQTIDPPIPLHDVRITSAAHRDQVPRRWRTAALSRYDGRRWSPDLVLRPIGRRLGPEAPDAIAYSVTFENDDLRLVPLPGAPIVIDAPIETDRGRTLVGLVERPLPGEPYGVTANVERAAEDAVGAIGLSDDADNPTAFAELATELARQGGAEDSTDFLEQLRAIEATMRDDFVLRTDAPGGGLQRLLIERFLRTTQRGNAEQFSTAFVLLARSLGIDARVATGFTIDPGTVTSTDDEATFTILSSDAAVWPEVRIGDEWVAFDPTPEEESSDASPPEPEPQIQTPAAPQPPIDPPPDATDDPVVTDDTTDEDPTAGLPIVVTYALFALAGLGALLLPVLVYVIVVLGAKRRRRRTRLSGPPARRVRGAWSLATNALVDGGMSIATGHTNDEIAAGSAPYAPNAQPEVRRLATLASSTTFGDPRHPEHLADDARTCLERVELTMTEERTRRERIRWRLSLRSLRRRTASPV